MNDITQAMKNHFPKLGSVSEDTYLGPSKYWSKLSKKKKEELLSGTRYSFAELMYATGLKDEELEGILAAEILEEALKEED